MQVKRTGAANVMAVEGTKCRLWRCKYRKDVGYGGLGTGYRNRRDRI